MGLSAEAHLDDRKLDTAGLDQDLHAELVTALYQTPKSMLVATLVAVSVVAISQRLSADPMFGLIVAGFLIVGLARVSANSVFLRKPPDRRNASAIRAWERIALAGAWSFAALVGIAGG
jgi:hypothetical protein